MQKILLVTALLTGSVVIPAAWADEALPPITNKAVSGECSECHMAFQPQLLPQRSWVAIMATLENHFGEDASLDPAQASEIEAYLVANAADVSRSREGRKMLRNVGKDQTPLRITELPRFRHEHSERKVASYRKRYNVRSMVDCKACHRNAEDGYYDDD